MTIIRETRETWRYFYVVFFFNLTQINTLCSVDCRVRSRWINYKQKENTSTNNINVKVVNVLCLDVCSLIPQKRFNRFRCGMKVAYATFWKM